MAFDETCAGALLAMKSSASQSLTYSNRTLNHMSDAWVHWNALDDHEAIEDVLHGLSDANIAAGYAGYGYAPFDYVGPWWWYLTNCVAGVSLEAMIAAVIAPEAHDDHRSAWILLWDAYRASMYDKPFDQEYHNAWVQRFKSWT